MRTVEPGRGADAATDGDIRAGADTRGFITLACGGVTLTAIGVLATSGAPAPGGVLTATGELTTPDVVGFFVAVVGVAVAGVVISWRSGRAVKVTSWFDGSVTRIRSWMIPAGAAGIITDLVPPITDFAPADVIVMLRLDSARSVPLFLLAGLATGEITAGADDGGLKFEAADAASGCTDDVGIALAVDGVIAAAVTTAKMCTLFLTFIFDDSKNFIL